MNNKTRLKNLLVIATAIFLFTGRQCYATSYASDLTNSAGIVSFRLNDNADNVKIISSGGAVTNDLGPGVKGLTVTNLGIASGTIKVVVTRSAPAGYTQISNDGFQDNGVYVNKFEQPRGVVVNKNPASPSFGRIYVANGRGEAATGGTFVRTTYQGIYAINADDTVALDTGTFPRTAGLGFTPGNTATPNRLHIGKDDNQLYICDWSDPSGGLWVTDLDVTTGTNVLEGVGDLASGSTTHGSVAGVWVEGTAGSNLKVFTTDEDLTPGNSLWRYDVGNAALPYQGSGTLLGSPAVSTSQIMDVVRGGSSNYLYLTQRRSVGTEANIFVFTEDGTFITNSLLASRAYTGISTNVDLLREALAVDISPDGSTLTLLRANVTPTVLLIPLTNGVFNFAGTNGFNIGSTSSNNRDIAYDAAGNLYVVNTSVEWLRIFSRGGATIATTGTDGTFTLATPLTLVSASASVATANEQGPVNGQFTLTRAGDLSGPLTVGYTLSGTATLGTDYTNNPAGSSVTFVPGAASTNIAVVVTNDLEPEFTETAILTVNSSANYGIGTGSATVSIFDDETPQISFNTTATNKLLESYAPSKVTLQLARRGLLTPSLTVNLSYSGAATQGADFNGPLTVALGANVATADITLTPINDQAYEGNKLAVASVAAGAGYTIGTASFASALVVDDEYPAGTVLFSDDFNGINSSNLWQVNVADPNDCFVEFNYDYGAVGIPVAPGTTDGSRMGTRFRCGNTVLQIDGLSISPTNGNFTGDYRLKFDMWINYNGPMPDGGAGSTQNFDAGVGTAGDQVVWRNNPSADGIWFTATGDGADGNTGGDYTAYGGPNILNDDTGFYAAGTGAPNSGVRNGSHPFYSYWGGQTAPAAQLALFPNQTGVANIGNAGMAWHTVVLTKVTNTVAWAIDGIVVCTVTDDPVNLSTNVFVGYQDLFASGTLSDVPEMSFGLVDNLKVERFVSAPISITNIRIVGSNVEITFAGPAEAVASVFKLQSAAVVGGTYLDDNSAIITPLGSGLFKATTALSGPNRFYRLKR